MTRYHNFIVSRFFVLTMLAFVAVFGSIPARAQEALGTRPSTISGDPTFGLLALDPIVSEVGRISLSIDGSGSNEGSAIIQVEKPVGATVRRALMFAASTGFSGNVIADGDITIDSAGVIWEQSLPSAINSNNYFADITSIIKPTIDAAPSGRIDLAVTENQPFDIEGEILAVIFDDPNQPSDNTVLLFFGAQNTTGDVFNIGLAQPVDPADPSSVLDFSLGISFGFQPSGQFSTVDINGQRLTSSAGGQDDGVDSNGALITVGGLDDSNENPADPFANATEVRSDDELYNLKPFVTNSTTLITIETQNPSNDDNIFFAGVFLSVPAIVGEGLTLAPLEATNPVDTEHTVTATVRDTNGNPVAEKLVTFNVIDGPHAGISGSSTTDSNGEAGFSYTGTIPGTDSIQASFIDSQEQTQFSNVVKKVWESTGFNITGNVQYDITDGPVQDVTMTLSRGVDASTETIRVEADIDGTSELILRANTARWHHLGAAAPGRLNFNDEPTVINGNNWFPVWPDIPDAENRDCDCFSDIFSGVNPPLPQTDMIITLRIIRSRFQTRIVQLPAASNNYTLIIEYDDGPPGGSDLYITEIDFTFVENDDDSDVQITDSNGDYIFSDLEEGLDYTVTPSKEDDIAPGSISCFDASLIAQYVVDLTTFSEAQHRAADVDEDGNIYAFDAALTCRFAIDLPPFDANDEVGDWRFLPAGRVYENLQSSQFEQDYDATLLGDVDANFAPTNSNNLTLTGENSPIDFGEVAWSQDGKRLSVEMAFDGRMEAFAFELDLIYAADKLRLLEAGNRLTGWQFFENATEPGRVQAGMFSTIGLESSSPLVRFEFEVVEPFVSTELSLQRAMVNDQSQPPAHLIVESARLAGDLDGDGVVNVADLIAVINFILGVSALTDAQIVAADLNGDTVVDVQDLIRMIRIILANHD